MFHSTRLLAIPLILLIAGCATAPSGNSFDSAIGEWNERYETMNGNTRSTVLTISDETRAIYSNPTVQIAFYSIDDQRRWKGDWTGESGANPCSVERNGSQYWGEQILHFNETYNQYTGTWNACGEGPNYPYNGIR